MTEHEHTWRLDWDGQYWLHCDCGMALAGRDLAEEYPGMEQRLRDLDGQSHWTRMAEAQPPSDRPLWLAIFPNHGQAPVVRATRQYGMGVYYDAHGYLLQSAVITHWMLCIPPAPPKEAG